MNRLKLLITCQYSSSTVIWACFVIQIRYCASPITNWTYDRMKFWFMPSCFLSLPKKVSFIRPTEVTVLSASWPVSTRSANDRER